MVVAGEVAVTATAEPYYVTEEPDAGQPIAWRPLSDPQARALASSASELLYGGAKGGMKTETLLVKPLYQVHKPRYAGAFVRTTFKDLARPLDRAKQIYNALPGHLRPAWNGEKSRYTFPSGAIVQFGYTEKGLNWAQGGEWAEVLWDEMGNEPDPGKIETLISEIRCPDPTCVRQLAGSANPGFAGHPWVKKRWVNLCGKKGERVHFYDTNVPGLGTVTRSREFIPSKVTDNPIYANDADYMAALMNLPDRMRRCLLDGDWDAATGAALDEMDESRHMITPFQIPSHWPYMAGFDWGYVHWSVFIHARATDDGRIVVVDTIKRRLLRDWDLAGAFEELVPVGARSNVQSGSDVASIIRARDEQKSTKDTFADRKINLVPVQPGRVHSYLNLLKYLSWRPSDHVPERDPMLVFFDTPGNRWLYEQLSDMVLDPDDPRDVLKVDANAETGDGGDDGYDALRTMLAQRPLVAKSGYDQLGLSAFDPLIMSAEAARAAKSTVRPDHRRRQRHYF